MFAGGMPFGLCLVWRGDAVRVGFGATAGALMGTASVGVRGRFVAAPEADIQVRGTTISSGVGGPTITPPPPPLGFF